MGEIYKPGYRVWIPHLSRMGTILHVEMKPVSWFGPALNPPLEPILTFEEFEGEIPAMKVDLPVKKYVDIELEIVSLNVKKLQDLADSLRDKTHILLLKLDIENYNREVDRHLEDL